MKKIKKIEEDMEEGILGEFLFDKSTGGETCRVILRDMNCVEIMIEPDQENCKQSISLGVKDFSEFVEKLSKLGVIEKLESLIELRKEEQERKRKNKGGKKWKN